MASQFFNSWNTIMTRAMESPQEWVKTMTGFYQDQFNLWVNMFNPSAAGTVHPVPGDRRFDSPEWDESPLHNYLKQSYLLSSRWLSGMISDSTLDESTRNKCDFYTRQFIDAMSPSNFAVTNPEVLKETKQGPEPDPGSFEPDAGYGQGPHQHDRRVRFRAG
jgi:polyhydroxyalkanoate synthase